MKRYLEQRNITRPESMETTAATLPELEMVSSLDSLKATSSHVEAVEVGSGPSTPAPTSPAATIRQPLFRGKTDQTLVADDPGGKQDSNPAGTQPETMTAKSADKPIRRGSMSQIEATIPAWCFLSLLPFYASTNSNDSSFAEHFATKRPILGMCLKRYGFENGRLARNGIHVEIPLEIGFPVFVTDDGVGESDGSIYGNFKLVLRSVVCHRGTSIQSGHYISLVRGRNDEIDQGRWLLFDDMQYERVQYVDPIKALAEESPYLLFYQVEPIDGHEDDYSGAQITPEPSNDVMEKLFAAASEASENGELEEADPLPVYTPDDMNPSPAQVSSTSTSEVDGSESRRLHPSGSTVTTSTESAEQQLGSARNSVDRDRRSSGYWNRIRKSKSKELNPQPENTKGKETADKPDRRFFKKSQSKENMLASRKSTDESERRGHGDGADSASEAERPSSTIPSSPPPKYNKGKHKRTGSKEEKCTFM